MQSKIRLLLNTADRDTNIIFDQETGVRFTPQNPYVEISKISKGIEKSISVGKIIDIDNVTGIKVDKRSKLIHDRLLRLVGIAKRINNDIDKEAKLEDKAKEIVNNHFEESVDSTEPKEEKPKAQRKNKKKGDE